MTRPVNLYLLSRIPDKDAFNDVCRHVSEKTSAGSTPQHEIQSLRTFADEMIREGVAVPALDGFFFGYKIPQIGKEFDLLKFRPGALLSIELKSQPVPLSQIRAQLLRNRHYLSHLGREMQLFTFVSDTRQCFRLTEGDALTPAAIGDLAKAVQSFTDSDVTEIDGMFRASEYIVSPSGTPEKFLAREYFLTQAQDQIRTHLLDALGQTTGLSWFSLTGKPGTGKTLLLYDVGRTLAAEAGTVILHWGELTEGHKVINAANIGLTILPQEELEDVDGSVSLRDAAAVTETASPWDAAPAETSQPRDAASPWDAAAGVETASPWDAAAPSDTPSALPSLAPYSYVLVDESHRLSPRQFQIICESARAYRQRVVFCLDPEQVLTTAERKNDIAGRVNLLPPDASFTLSEHLRGNRELQAFIQEVRDLNNKPSTHLAYRDVDLGFAADLQEARNQLAYYRDRGYVFINYYRTSQGNPFAEFEGGYDIHHVIGQEFDRVVLLLDDSFYYTDEGKLEGIPSPDPDFIYPNLFYQSITRVQEKLALIVLENEPLFNRIVSILN